MTVAVVGCFVTGSRAFVPLLLLKSDILLRLSFSPFSPFSLTFLVQYTYFCPRHRCPSAGLSLEPFSPLFRNNLLLASRRLVCYSFFLVICYLFISYRLTHRLVFSPAFTVAQTDSKQAGDSFVLSDENGTVLYYLYSSENKTSLRIHPYSYCCCLRFAISV